MYIVFYVDKKYCDGQKRRSVHVTGDKSFPPCNYGIFFLLKTKFKDFLGVDDSERIL